MLRPTHRIGPKTAKKINAGRTKGTNAATSLAALATTTPNANRDSDSGVCISIRGIDTSYRLRFSGFVQRLFAPAAIGLSVSSLDGSVHWLTNGGQKQACFLLPTNGKDTRPIKRSLRWVYKSFPSFSKT